MGEIPFALEKLIGQTVMINPRFLINRKRLYTVQTWIDTEKLINAVKGKPEVEDEPPRGWVACEKNDLVYILSDGNHRTALSYITGSTASFLIDGVWQNNKDRFGFNIIIQKVKHDLKQCDGCS